MPRAALETQRDKGQLLVVPHHCHPVLNCCIEVMLQYVSYALGRWQPASYWVRELVADRYAKRADCDWFHKDFVSGSRTAAKASSIAGYRLSIRVAACGWVSRKALTTVKPPPPCGTCKSESNASKVSGGGHRQGAKTCVDEWLRLLWWSAVDRRR